MERPGRTNNDPQGGSGPLRHLPTDQPEVDIPGRDQQQRSLLPIAEYEGALDEEGTVSFNQVVDSAYLRFHHVDSEKAKAYEVYYPKLLRKFAAEHQRIERAYFANHVHAAAILTRDKELFVQYPRAAFKDVEFLELLSRLMLLHVRARQFLNESDYKDCMDPVFEAITHCLSSFDVPRDLPPPLIEDESGQKAHKARLTAMLTSAYERAESDLWQMVQRRALVTKAKVSKWTAQAVM